MHLSMPDIIFVPFYFAEEDTLNIKIDGILDKSNCGNGLTNNPLNRKDIVIGVSLPNLVRDRWVRAKKYMEDYAKEKGVSVKIENADYDAAKQDSQVENLISQGIDILVVAPVNVFSAADMVEKAHKARIKVISYDRLIQNSNPDIYIAFNSVTVGELQGRYLVEKVPRGNYIIIYGSTFPGFKEGAMEYIKPLVDKGDIKIVADKDVKNWDPNIAFKVVEDALASNNNKIDAILAPNDATAGGAIEALKAQGLDGKVVVTGQDADLDAVRRIIERTQAMTVFKDIRKEAKTVIDTAISLAKGEDVIVNGEAGNDKFKVPSIFVTPIVIDNDNLKSALIDGGYYKQSEVYR